MGHYHFHHSFAISLLILLLSTTSHHRLFYAQGRKLAQTPDNSQTTAKNTIWRAQIGSRPPRCERLCGNCHRCQAIQVPTNGRINHSSAARDDGASNYKPMSWKCKCDNIILNP